MDQKAPNHLYWASWLCENGRYDIAFDVHMETSQPYFRVIEDILKVLLSKLPSDWKMKKHTENKDNDTNDFFPSTSSI